MSKAPAFQFYPMDWLTDAHVMAMTLEEQGAYVRLLCHQWLEGKLSSDLSLLAKFCGVSLRKMKAMWPNLGPCFEDAGDGFIANSRLTRARLDRESWLEKSSRGGKVSAENRASTRDRGVKGGCALVEPPLQPKLNTSSSTSSSKEDIYEQHIGQVVGDLWAELGLGVPRMNYDAVMAMANVTTLTAHYTDEEIIAQVHRVAGDPKMRSNWGGKGLIHFVDRFENICAWNSTPHPQSNAGPKARDFSDVQKKEDDFRTALKKKATP